MQNDTTIDPVCGMTVDPASAAGTSSAGGRTWHFCSTHCKARFDADPDAFSAAPQDAPASCSSGHCCR